MEAIGENIVRQEPSHATSTMSHSPLNAPSLPNYEKKVPKKVPKRDKTPFGLRPHDGHDCHSDDDFPTKYAISACPTALLMPPLPNPNYEKSHPESAILTPFVTKPG